MTQHDVVFRVRDLLFVSKIRETAKQKSVTVFSAKSDSQVLEYAEKAKLIILDLRLEGALALVDALHKERPSTPVIGFIDHELVDVMVDAKKRGCADVLAKGQFSATLPRLFSFDHVAS